MLVMANVPGTLHSQRRPTKSSANAYYLALLCQACGDIQTQDLSSRGSQCCMGYPSEKHLPLTGGGHDGFLGIPEGLFGDTCPILHSRDTLLCHPGSSYHKAKLRDSVPQRCKKEAHPGIQGRAWEGC